MRAWPIISARTCAFQGGGEVPHRLVQESDHAVDVGPQVGLVLHVDVLLGHLQRGVNVLKCNVPIVSRKLSESEMSNMSEAEARAAQQQWFGTAPSPRSIKSKMPGLSSEINYKCMINCSQPKAWQEHDPGHN